MTKVNLPVGIPINYHQEYRRCGKSGCTYCVPGGRGHGPYWVARWTAEGRRHKRYLGRALPAGADPDVTSAVQVVPQKEVASLVAPSAPLRVQVLGGFAVWRAGVLIPAPAWQVRQAGTLFKVLLAAPAMRLRRKHASVLLWPDRDGQAAGAALRQCLHQLRQLLSTLAMPNQAAFVITIADDVLMLTSHAGGRLDDEPLPPEEWLDAAAFRLAATQALSRTDPEECSAALALYTGDYLPSDLFLDAEWDEPWLRYEREALRHLHLRLLLHLASLYATAGEVAAAEDQFRAVLQRVPSHEEAAAQLMGLLTADGQYAAALRVYRAVRRALKQEFGLPPAPELQALRVRLVAQRAAPLAVHLPPRSALAMRHTNLPVAASSFIGREQEQAEVRHRLESTRLLTLTGTGGSGKTRLALAVAGSLVERYSDGVWLVELAVRSDASLVARAVAHTFGVQEEPDCPLLETLSAFLAPRQLLLVLDNCEHLRAASATLAESLLRAAPHLHILTTSREPLGLMDEMVWVTPPLTIPPEDMLPPEALVRYEAVQLFVERACAVQPTFQVTPTTASAVTAICRRLDGLPLAIELAAARLGLLSVQEIATRLTDCFQLLTGGSRTALPRQHTLRATLNWSYTLLTEAERLLLCRTSVFAGGWTLKAAESVCVGDLLHAGDLSGLLGALVRKSLIEVEDIDNGVRYRLLETVRQYAGEHLDESGLARQVRNRHLEWCCLLVEEAEPHLTGPDQAYWLTFLETEHDNIRVALGWAQGTEQVEQGLRLVGKLTRFWWWRGYMSEGRAWLADVLDRARLAGAAQKLPSLVAKALNAAAVLAFHQGDYERSTPLHEEALVIRRQLSDPLELSRTLYNLGAGAYIQGDYDYATTLYDESLTLRRAIHDTSGIAYSLSGLGNIARDRGAVERAAALFEESLALHRTLGDTFAIAYTLFVFSVLARNEGHHEQALILLEESLALHRELGNTGGVALALNMLGNLARDQGVYDRAAILLNESLAMDQQRGDRWNIATTLADLGLLACTEAMYERARTMLRQSLTLRRVMKDRSGIAICLERLAGVACRQGQPMRAVYLGVAANKLHAQLGTSVPLVERPFIEQTIVDTRKVLGDAAFSVAWATGEALSLDDAIELALQPSVG